MSNGLDLCVLIYSNFFELVIYSINAYASIESIDKTVISCSMARANTAWTYKFFIMLFQFISIPTT